jgi:hypothetical protein
MKYSAGPAREKGGPYGAGWAHYHERDWPTVPVRGKQVFLRGYTGWDGEDASLFVLRKWAGRYEALNIALRMPPGVVGVDVDTRHDGDVTLAKLEAELGPLPETYRSTSRAPEDQVGGIRFFRVPTGTVLAGKVEPGIELVQRHHRVAVVWPSLHPDTGREYGWLPDGIPRSGDMAVMPDVWVEGLTDWSNDTGPRGHPRKASLGAAREWYRSRAYGEPCAFMTEQTERAIARIRDKPESSATYDVMVAATYALSRWASDGHPGLHGALRAVQGVFLAAPRSRGRDPAGEWQRAVGDAARVMARQDAGDEDPCIELEGFRVRW